MKTNVHHRSRYYAGRSAIPMAMAALLLATALPAYGQDTRISGYVFGDYYYVASSHNANRDGSNGLWFRRIYLTLDHQINEGWSARLRGEMNQPGDFETRAKMEPFIKDAYVRWSNGRHQIMIGMAPAPTWERVEKVWGYRAVEKTALDFYKFGSSRDIGIAAKGKIDAEGRFQYHAMLGNGSGTSSEVNKGKKAMLSLAVSPVEAVTFEAYTDYEDRGGGSNRSTYQGAVFYQPKQGRIGVQYAHQIRRTADASDESFDVFSVFGALRLNDRMSAFGRYDRQFQPNPSGESIPYCPIAETGEANFIVGGLDIGVHDNVHFMPNVEVIFYSNAQGDAPSADVLPRLTFFYRF